MGFEIFKSYFTWAGSHDAMKKVRVYDRRVCIVKWLGMIAIVSLTAYDLLGNLSYCRWHPVSVWWKMFVRQPVNNCNIFKESCEDDFTRRRTLSYCCRQDCEVVRGDVERGGCFCDNRTEAWQKSFKCRYQDYASGVTYFDESVLISSFVHQVDQKFNETCKKLGKCNRLWNQVKSTRFYVADIERFQVFIDHTVHQEKLGIDKTINQMQGYLSVPAQFEAQHLLCKRYGHHGAPCKIVPNSTSNNKLDQLSLGTILESAGVGNLDELRFKDQTFPKTRSMNTIRRNGLILKFKIEYHNARPWLGITNDISYTYEFTAMPRDNCEYTKGESYKDSDHRKIRHTHGILIKGESRLNGGRLASFHPFQLILRLIAMVHFLGALSCALGFYWKHVSRDAEVLRASHLEYFRVDSARLLLDKSEDDLRNMLRERDLPSGGNRITQVVRLVASEGYGSESSCNGVRLVASDGSGSEACGNGVRRVASEGFEDIELAQFG